MTATCRHCGALPIRVRGLCRTCYYSPMIRARYASASQTNPPGEPTDAELDLLVAARRATMPGGAPPKKQPAYTIPVYRTTQRRVPPRGSLGHGRN